jgi:hypothetical protein
MYAPPPPPQARSPESGAPPGGVYAPPPQSAYAGTDWTLPPATNTSSMPNYALSTPNHTSSMPNYAQSMPNRAAPMPNYAPQQAFSPPPTQQPPLASRPDYSGYTPHVARRTDPPPGMNPNPPAGPYAAAPQQTGSPGAMQAGRPFSGPDGYTPRDASVTPQTPQYGNTPAERPEGEIFEAAQVIARVGDEPVLAGEVMGMVNQVIEANRDKIPPGQEQVLRDRFTQQLLENEIQTKLLYLDFLRQVRANGAGPEKINEILGRVYTQFDEKRLPELLETTEVASAAELDAKLREHGSSLMKQKRQFAQKVMAQQWMRDSGKVDFKPIITHAQMLDYYYAHEADYAFPAKARWEHLMARFDKFPNKQAAYAAIQQMGNEVYLGGAPLSAVAKRGSHGVTASSGGLFESTTKGSLRSQVLDEAVFSLPVNRLSPILEDEEGLHIVRVLERTEAGRQSFESVQSEIKEAIRKEHVQKQIDKYLDDLRRSTPVWTIYDDKKDQDSGALTDRS